MKKIYFAILILFTIHPTFSQVNDYFLNNPQWKIKYQVFSGSDCTGWVDTYNYNENGDTIIGSLTYKKIIKKGIYSPVDFFCNPYSPASYTNSNPSCFIRSAGKQMYVIEPGSTTEELLYDFNLNIGDTIPLSYTNLGYTLFTVSSIDSVFTPFGYRKRFALNPSGYLYEGIGSSAGLVEEMNTMFLHGTSDLLCFSLNDISYVPTTGSSCNMIVGIDDIGMKETAIAFPNPFSNSTTIQFNHTLNGATMNLYNSIGATIKSINISRESLVIERGNLSSGIYYYQILQENGNVLNGKLMIVD